MTFNIHLRVHWRATTFTCATIRAYNRLDAGRCVVITEPNDTTAIHHDNGRIIETRTAADKRIAQGN